MLTKYVLIHSAAGHSMVWNITSEHRKESVTFTSESFRHPTVTQTYHT